MKTMEIRMTLMAAATCATLSVAGFANGNLITNGGFEADADGTTVSGNFVDSTTFTNWRAFAVGDQMATFTVNAASAFSGLVGMQIERTAIGGGDSALDIDPFRVSAVGGEILEVSFASKKASNEDTQIAITVAMFNSEGGHLGDLGTIFAPGTDAWGTFSDNYTLAADTVDVNVGFRVVSATGAPAIGAYQIDDVSVTKIPEPASLLLLLAGGTSLAVCRWRRCA